MKYRIFIFALLFVWSISACSKDDNEENPVPENPGTSVNPENPDDKDEGEEDKDNENGEKEGDNMNIQLLIGDNTFSVTLEENETAIAFKELLPMTIDMRDLNSNEKYYNLLQHLPTAPTNPGTINRGDLMLYGSNCVVLFYKTFPTSYRYTKIGRIDNPSGLEAMLGTGNATVKIDEKL